MPETIIGDHFIDKDNIKNMKKTITIIIIIFILLLAGIGYYVYINSGNQNVSSGGIFNSVKNFFPFGTPNSNTQTPTQVTNTQSESSSTPFLKIDRMFQISDAPIAGYIAKDVISTTTQLYFNKDKNATTSSSTKQTETFVDFVERATGHIFESKISKLEKSRLSNNTIPKVYDSYLNSNGTEFITRTLSGESIVTEFRKISVGTSTASTTQVIRYPSNTDVLIGAGDNVFYTIKNSNGSIGYLSSFDNKKPTQIFSTPLRDVGASWNGGNSLEIYSKPNSQYGGISFIVDLKKKTSNQDIADINGLTTNPSYDGAYVLYNTDIDKLSLGAKKSNTNNALYLGIKTLPEKCVWSKKNTKVAYCAVPNNIQSSGYPEKWYQGLTSFNDDFWSINVVTGEQKPIYRPEADSKPPQDVINLKLNDKENYLFFENKKDLTLWGLSI